MVLWQLKIKKRDYQLHLSPSFHVLVPQWPHCLCSYLFASSELILHLSSLLSSLSSLFNLKQPSFHSKKLLPSRWFLHLGNNSRTQAVPGSTLLSQLTTSLLRKADAEIILAPRQIAPLVPALASKLLSWYSSFSYFMDDILCWTSCSGMSVYVLHCTESILFMCFPFISYQEVYCLLVFILWFLLTSYLSEMEFTWMGSAFHVMNITKNDTQTCQCFVTQN